MSYGNIAVLQQGLLSLSLFCMIAGSMAIGIYEKDIYENIVKNYGSVNVIPVKNTSHPISVTMRLLIAQLVEFNEPKQQITINGWQRLSWRDEFLVWDPDDYGGQNHIYVMPSDIWVPRLVVLENVEYDFTSIKDLEVTVEADGSVTWYTPVMLKTSCKVQVRLFPFDTQRCNVTLTPWSHSLQEIDLLSLEDEETRQAVYSPNGIWHLVDATTTRFEKHYACCKYPYAHVTDILTFERAHGYYLYSVLIPSVLLKMVTLAVFCMPPESGEKVSFAMTNLLAFVLFEQLIAVNMPPLGDDTPILTVYIFCMVVEACLSVCASVIVLRLFHYPDNKLVGGRVERVLVFLGYEEDMVTWQLVARALDKAFFVVFLLVSVLIVSGTYIQLMNN